MSSPSFCFTGGGTGGHVAPNLAIAEAIRAHYPVLHSACRSEKQNRVFGQWQGDEIASGLAEVHYALKGFGVSPK